MEPKTKAAQIVFSFYPITVNNDYNKQKEMARQCALVTINEIIAVIHGEEIEFWQDVKQEIQKL